jgi:hypothetical protein
MFMACYGSKDPRPDPIDCGATWHGLRLCSCNTRGAADSSSAAAASRFKQLLGYQLALLASQTGCGSRCTASDGICAGFRAPLSDSMVRGKSAL